MAKNSVVHVSRICKRFAEVLDLRTFQCMIVTLYPSCGLCLNFPASINTGDWCPTCFVFQHNRKARANIPVSLQFAQCNKQKASYIKNIRSSLAIIPSQLTKYGIFRYQTTLCSSLHGHSVA